MEKKQPKVWEKIVLKIYWSTVQVLIKHLDKVKDWWEFSWVIVSKDESGYGKSDLEVEWQQKPKRLHNEIKITWRIDEYGNWWN